MIKGWCPDLFTPMQSGDGWLVRVRPRRSVLSAAHARVIADAAGRYGSGIVELTNRGNVQIRGLTPASAGSFASAMVDAGVADGAFRHNLLVSPLSGVDPSVHPQTTCMADSLDSALAEAGDLGGLPDKFLFLVDGGGAAGLQRVRADIAVRAIDEKWTIWLDGEPLGAACETGRIADAVIDLARAFMADGSGARRIHSMVQSRGAAQLLRNAGLVADISPDPGGGAGWIGFQPFDEDLGGFALGIPFGQMRAGDLRNLAGFSEHFGDARLRITPGRTIIIAGVTADQEIALRNALKGWIVEADDPRRRVIACPGLPGCASATVRARQDAEFLASLPLAALVHVSGCGKGCAHPFAAPFTLVGREGTYDIVRNGRADDAPCASGLTMAEAARIVMETA